jgi:diguanylate cyclase (GGDEF)-like protein
MKHLTSSVGARTILATSIMLIPMLLMAAANTFFFMKIGDDVRDAEVEVRRELVPVVTLQTLLLKVVMPPNDYLIHRDVEGRAKERANFAQLAKEVDKALEVLDEIHFSEGEERAALLRVRNQWMRARGMGQELVESSYPLEDPPAMAHRMERFDKVIDDTIHDLDYLVQYISDELGEHVERVETTKADATAATLVTVAIAILIAVVGGLTLARTILNPIRALGEGVSQLQAGHLNHRVNLSGDDELGKLGNTLNAMATRIEQLATRDELTGLYVRREFNRFFLEEISRAARSGRPFSLLLVDADHFKDINDRYGHRVGDRVLRTLALVLNRDMRAVDRVARIGGEEFAVILPDTQWDAAMETAERIRSMTAAKQVHSPDGKIIRITISIGVATFPQNGDTMDALVEAADQALYRAKAEGRNCVRQAAAVHLTSNASMGKSG